MGAIFCLYNGIPVQSSAQQIITLTPQTQFEFADSLYKNKDYPAAKVEFQKFLFFSPRTSMRIRRVSRSACVCIIKKTMETL